MAPSFLALVAMATVCYAVVPEDEIKMMPGLSKQPPFKQYSGYLKASGTKKLHYWFVESMNNPATDPVVLWLNGGPGCSSDMGLLSENGPFNVMPDGKTVTYSKTSWSSVANMLWLEAPAGVGFSYSDDKNYTTDDNEVAHDNYLALKDFFSMYQNYSKNEFFITGESYGGIYVPTLSSLVVDDKEINFKGMGIGNGLSSDKFNDNSLLYFIYYHGLIGDSAFKDLQKFCCSTNSTERCYFTDMMQDPQCQKVVTAASTVVFAGGLNIFNLYGECAGGVMSRKRPNSDVLESSNFGYPFGFLDTIRKDRMRTESASKLKFDPPCIDASRVVKYLNSEEVKTALHIPSVVQHWERCSEEVVIYYIRVYRDVSAQYKKVLAAGKRVLVYNGDVDMACNFLGDEWFVNGLGIQTTSARKEWFYKAEDGTKQVAGFVKQFDNLSLVTVRGAGHMVPTDRPVPGLEMFKSFIKGQPLV
ncbi:lysosomal protective protein-like [Haliotis asinina]|uniref:lysosomal protective protein-like n=1 Tax=Haliotis asinina TaxID=109174 RepID=UPI00353261D9